MRKARQAELIGKHQKATGKSATMQVNFQLKCKESGSDIKTETVIRD